MSKVAESSVKTLIEARVKRIYGIVGDSLNQITDAIRRGNLSNGFTFATRSSAVCDGSLCAHNGRAGSLRQELRSRQPSPHQRALRLPSKLHAGSTNCGTYSE
jgi:hypothetical protein